MSSDELKENTFYSINTQYTKGRFQYAGEVDFQGVKREIPIRRGSRFSGR